MDWSHLQSFAAVAEHGSLSGAALALNSSQPTLSRHITQLEQRLGQRLFERSKAGVTLTEAGLDLIDHARTMADAAARLAMVNDGHAQGLAGTVRITASQIMATFVLPDVLTGLRAKYPALSLELVASDETNNLLRREADIAVRMYRPQQNDVVAQHVGDMALAAYATPDYITRRGALADRQDLLTHDLIGYDRSTLIIDGLRDVGIAAKREDFAFRSDDQVVCWQMVRAGFGIGFNQMAIGDADPTVTRVSGADPVGHIPIWLTAHPEVRSNPRVRRVYDHLRDALRPMTQHA